MVINMFWGIYLCLDHIHDIIWQKKYMSGGPWVSLEMKKICLLCLNSWLTMVDYARGAGTHIGSFQAVFISSTNNYTILVD